MRLTILTTLAAAAVLISAPRGARACSKGGRGYGGLMTAMMVAGGTDALLTLWDTGSAMASHHPSVGYGVVELLVSAPQLVLGLVARNGDTRSGALLGYTIWMGLLTSHAIWTIGSAQGSQEGSGDPDREARVRPAPSAPPRALVALAPTYVPLGERAHPGLGLVGRF